MDCKTAKKISIVGYLASQGINPDKTKNGAAWYCSPFRHESKASFKVDRNNNIWYDFGTGTGGNILDLVMQLNNTGVAGALLLLQKPEFSKHTFSFSEQRSFNHSSFEIKHIQALQNRALLQYLANRGISHSIGAIYIQEAYYQVNGKQYFALAFKNDKGGYELRNKYFKGSSSPKAITTIKGNQTVNLFEGFLDFLSALVHYNVKEPATTNIVLNSVANLHIVLPLLQTYKAVNLFFDNDAAGNKATSKVIKVHTKVTDYSKIIYPNHNDFNDFLVTK